MTLTPIGDIANPTLTKNTVDSRPYVTDGLVAYWNVEVATGDLTALFDAYNSNDMSNKSGDPQKGTTAGFVNEGTNLDGNDYWYTPQDAKYNPTSGFTGYCWFNEQTQTNYAGIMYAGSSLATYPNSAWGFDSNSSDSGNVFRAAVRSSGNQTTIGSYGSGSTGTWYLGVIRGDGNQNVEADLFDTSGTQLVNASASGGRDEGTALYLQCGAGAGEIYNGYVDELHFHNKRLTDSQIQTVVDNYTA